MNQILYSLFGVMFRKRQNILLFQSELIAYARTLCRDQTVAEDLVQEINLRVLSGAAIPKQHDDAKRYLFRMLRNLHIDNLRKAKVRLEYSAEQERLLSEKSDFEFNEIEKLVVRDAFSQLSDDHREVLFLIDIMGFKYDEVAETLAVARGTVMSRVSRARTELMEKLELSKVRPIRGAKRL